MNDTVVKAGGSGIGMGGLLFVLLVVIKLTNLAPTLTWFWVFSPLWIPFAVILGASAFLFLIACFVALFKK